MDVQKNVLLFFKYLFLVVLLHANLVHAKYPANLELEKY